MVMKEMVVERSTIRSILANIKQFLCGDACAAHRIYPNSNIFCRNPKNWEREKSKTRENPDQF